MKKLSIILLATSLACTCLANTLTSKTPEYEKITIVDDSADVAFMHTETYRITGENIGDFNIAIAAKGFDIVSRYDSAHSCGQLNYPCNGIDRREWRDLVTRNYYNDTALTRISFNKERESIGKVPLQRTGIKAKREAEAYTEAFNRKLTKAGYKVRFKDSRGTVSSLVGKDPLLGWRCKPRLQNHKSCHLDN